MKPRTKQRPRRKPKRQAKRSLRIENLESRQLLAVDGFTIDLSGTGTVDLLNPSTGRGVHDVFTSGNLATGNGVTVGTSNVPGQNNQNPIAGDDTFLLGAMPQPLISTANLLANDSDPDSSGPLSIIAVSNESTDGTATLFSDLYDISYVTGPAFDQLASGEEGSDTFEYTLDDSKNGRGTGTVTIHYTGVNDAPTISGTPNIEVDEGSTATNTGTYNDVDNGAVVALSASLGDVVSNDGGTWSWSLPTTDGDHHGQTITITATDEHNVATTFDFTLNVNNVAPTIAVTGSDSTDEGSVYQLTLGVVTDPGNDTITEYEIDWGDGSNLETFTDNLVPVKTHVYTDGPSDHTITVSITDEDGKHVAATKSISVRNIAPTVAGDQISVTVDEGSDADMTGTYGDVGNDTVVVTASMGTLTQSNDGTWAWFYETTDGPTESQTVTVTATDSDGASTETTFDLIVNNVNPDLTVTNPVATVDEGTTATNVGTYADVGGDTVTLSVDVGDLIDNHDGTWSWSYDSTDGPDQSQTVTITATDEDGGETTTTFSLAVNNVAPVAMPQSINVLGNVPITREWATLLAGATDVGNDVISVQSIDSMTSVGTLTFDNIHQTFRYVPQTGFEGTTSFTFTVADSDGATHQETATIMIERSIWVVDNSADAGGDGSLASPFVSFAPINGTENDADADAAGDLILVVGTGTDYNVTHGQHNDHGFRLEDDQFLIGSGLPAITLETYLATQGITMPVGSDALPATGPSPTITNTTGDVITLADGNTIAGVTLDPVASAGIAGDGVEDLVVEFTIIVTSGGSGDNEGISLRTVTGTMTIRNVEIGTTDGQTNSGTAIQIDGGNADIHFNDVDIDQDGGALLQILNTAASTITIDENSEFQLIGSDEAAVTIAGNDNATVTFANSNNTNAAVTFNITGNHGLNVDTPVNDAPSFTITNPIVTIDEDAGTQTINAFATSLSSGPADESAQTLSFELTGNTNPGLFASGPHIDANGNLSFIPADDAHGTAAIVVTLRDNGGTSGGGIDASISQTMTIDINAINDAPVLAPIEAQSVDELQSLVFDTSASDVDFDSLAIGLHDPQQTGAVLTSSGQFQWTPGETDGGQTFQFEIFASDGLLEDRQTVTITVNEVNSVPMLASIGNHSIDEGHELAFTASATDADLPANTLTFSLGGDVPTGASITPAGDFSWTPTEAQGPGDYTFVVIVSDGEANASETITVSVADVNNAPVLASIGDRTIDEHSAIQLTLSATDSDLPANTLTFSLGEDAPAGMSITSDELSWTPNETQGGGSFTFDVIVSDGELSDVETVTWNVNETNDAPTLAAVGSQTLDERVLHTFTATASDSDLPTQNLTFSLAGNIPDGASISESGVFTWTPDETQQGTFTFDIVVSDGEASDTETINWTVNEVNVAPVFDAIADQSVNENETLTFNITATDVDLPQQNLTYSFAANAPNGATLASDGTFQWTPGESDGGKAFEFTTEVTDGVTTTTSPTITITVADTNVTPVVDAIPNQTVNEHQALTFTVNAIDSDQPQDTLTYSLGANAPDGASIDSNGVVFWLPGEIDGPAFFELDVMVNDGALTTTRTVVVTVVETNVAPLLSTIEDVSVTSGTPILFSASAIDSDLPTNQLSYSLQGQVPVGAALSSTGEFTWTPTFNQVGTHTLTIIVTDDATDALSDSQQFQVNVLDGRTALDSAAAMQFVIVGVPIDSSFTAQSALLRLGMRHENLTDSSQAYFQRPGSSLYRSTEATFHEIDDDDDPQTPTVLYAEFSGEYLSDDINNYTVANFHEDIGGQWNVLIDLDGDFDPNLPHEEPTEDAKFAFNVDSTSITLPPIPTITSPSYNQIVPYTQSLDVTWTTATNLTDETSVYVSIDQGSHTIAEANVDGSINSVSLTDLPIQTTLSATVLLSAKDQSYLTGPTLLNEFNSLRWEDLGNAFGDDDDFDAEGSTFTGLTVIGAESLFQIDAPPNQHPVIHSLTGVTENLGEGVRYSATVLEGHAFSATVQASDPEGSVLSYSLQNAPSQMRINSSGQITWTPLETQGPSTYLVNVVVSDGEDHDIEQFEISVGEVNHAPTFSFESSVVTVESDDGSQVFQQFIRNIQPGPFGEPNQVVRFAVTGNTHPELFSQAPVIDAAGRLIFNPQAIGTATIEVTATDDGGTDNGGVDQSRRSFTIEVAEPNVPPVIQPIFDQTTNEFSTVYIPISASDANEDGLTYSLENSPSNASINIVGLLIWNPGEYVAPGVHQFTVVVSDKEFSVRETFNIDVRDVNQPPTFDLASNFIELENREGLQQFTDLVENLLPGPEGETDQSVSLSVEFNSNPQMFSIQPYIDASGTLFFDPQSIGTARIDIVAQDDGGWENGGRHSSSRSFTIRITEVSYPPVIDPIGVLEIDELSELSLQVVATDANSDMLTYSLENAPSGATISSTGLLRWTPSEAQAPENYIFDVVVTDGIYTSRESVTVSALEVDLPLVILDIGSSELRLQETHSISFQVYADDPDQSHSNYDFSLSETAPHGMTISKKSYRHHGDAQAGVSWSPQIGQAGFYTFDVIATDGNDPSSLARRTFTIDVNDFRIPTSGSAELKLELRDQPLENATTLTSLNFELIVGRTDVDARTKAYLQLPGESIYHFIDTAFAEVQLQNQAPTSLFNRATFTHQFTQVHQSRSEFLADLNGTWTVFLDKDGESNPDAPSFVLNDSAVFQFQFNTDHFGDSPVLPQIKFPVDSESVSEHEPIELQWDVEGEIPPSLATRVLVMSGDQTILDAAIANTTRKVTLPGLPTNQPVQASILHSLVRGSEFLVPSPVGQYPSLRFGPTDGTYLTDDFHAIQAKRTVGDFVEFIVGEPSMNDQFAPMAQEAIQGSTHTGVSDSESQQPRAIPTQLTDPDDDLDKRINLLDSVLHELNHIVSEERDETVDDLLNAGSPTGIPYRTDKESDESDGMEAAIDLFDAVLADWSDELG